MAARGIYLAYPIDDAPAASMAIWYDWINQFKVEAIAQGATDWVFDPGDAFDVRRGAVPGPEVQIINRAALNQADCVVAFLPQGAPTYGVPIEINTAMQAGKTVVLVGGAGSWALRYPPAAEKRVIRVNPDEDGWVTPLAQVLRERDTSRETQETIRENLRVVLGPAGRLPTRAFADDAGLDLYTSVRTTIAPGTFADVPTDINIELPHWTWGFVTGRSSALRKRGLLVHTGVIDAGYRGPLYAGAWNMTGQDVVIEEGERVAQLIIHSNTTRHIEPVAVGELSQSARGSGGFGSTGA